MGNLFVSRYESPLWGSEAALFPARDSGFTARRPLGGQALPHRPWGTGARLPPCQEVGSGPRTPAVVPGTLLPGDAGLVPRDRRWVPGSVGRWAVTRARLPGRCL